MAKEIKNLLVNYIHDRQLKEFCAKYVGGRLVDIGCGCKPYHKMLTDLVIEHVGVDHAMTHHNKDNIDLFGDAYNIPEQDGSFDSAICTAVLEHLEEPGLALQECHRVLRSGGVAIYSAPLIWHVHEEPRDFYRYTKYGLNYLLEKAGFEILELKALSGFWVTFGQLFVYNIYRYNKWPINWTPIIPLIGLIIQAISFVLDKLDKSERWTWMYMVVVEKKHE